MEFIYEISYIFLMFYIYSIIGYICELIYIFFHNNFKFRDTGFLYGPYCPIYGFGALIVIFALKKYENDLIALFFLSVIFTGVLEYITSYLMEKLFNNKWWDYSEKKFNINGRVCLSMALLFGLLSVLVVHYINPSLSEFVRGMDNNVKVVTAILLGILLIIDTIKSAKVAFGFKGKLKKLRQEISEYIQSEYRKQEENKNNIKEEVYVKIKEGLEKINIEKDKKINAFKNMLNKIDTNKKDNDRKLDIKYIKEYINKKREK